MPRNSGAFRVMGSGLHGSFLKTEVKAGRRTAEAGRQGLLIPMRGRPAWGKAESQESQSRNNICFLPQMGNEGPLQASATGTFLAVGFVAGSVESSWEMSHTKKAGLSPGWEKRPGPVCVFVPQTAALPESLPHCFLNTDRIMLAGFSTSSGHIFISSYSCS